jgi:hypothetical protein
MSSNATQTNRPVLTTRPGRIPARPRRLRRLVLTTFMAALAFGVTTSSAWAATSAPALTIDAYALPSNFSAADNAQCLHTIRQLGPTCDEYETTVTNAGAQATSQPITISNTIPAGLTVQQIGFFWSGERTLDLNYPPSLCDTATVSCTFPIPLQPDQTLEMVVYLTVDDASQSGPLADTSVVSGGDAGTASTTTQNTVGEQPPPFGIVNFDSAITGLDGAPDTQAGDHPYEVTTRVDLRSMFREDPQGETGVDTSIEDVKDVVVDLPLGLMGSALAAPQCTLAQLTTPGTTLGTSACPPDTIVGAIATDPQSSNVNPNGPIYNLVPEKGVTAEFGFLDVLGGSHVLYARIVPGPSGYILQVTSPEDPQIVLTSLDTTFYGNPAVRDGSGNTQSAMFTNPSECDGQPLVTTVHIDSWEHPATFNPDGTPNLSDSNWVSATSTAPPVTGCDQLTSFRPIIGVQPDTSTADSPSGLHVEIKVPQSETPGTLATPPLDDATLTLPAGFTVNPSSAAGLAACTPAEIDLSGADPPACPQASQIATVQLTTPLIAGTLQGEVYLASEFDNPFHSLLAGYIVVDDPATGVVIKIPGNLTPNPITGQITAVFDNNPQFPFSDLQLDFKGGPTGVLATPEQCGSYTTTSLFSPWSFPDSGPAATPSSSFSIDSGCLSGFSPSFIATSQNARAGSFSPFVLSISRSDTDQNFSGLSVKLPPGMLAKLAGVGECSEAQLASISSQPGTGQSEFANPSCPANSQVGTVTTGAGTGPDPFFLGGKAYLTGPYKGAPYGLAVVVPAVAGPLDLGTVVVRQALYVDPTTAQVTDVSDPFPTILDGIPLRIRRVDVDLNRPDFTINPTSCDPMSVSADATSLQGATTLLSSPFQVGGCASLPFSPKLKMLLTGKGKTKSGDHPTLVSTLTQPFGQANLHDVRVALPLSLALDPKNSQHVCNYDVAQAVHGGAVGCPASTIVGTATAITPLLSEPLTGKVYLVQGIRFNQQGQRIRTLPSLLIPLRGQIALDLRAQTSVNGAQQLVTTFSTIPDAAVSKFTLTITGGHKGILVVTGRGRTICGKPQVTNATLNAQSGKSETENVTMSKSACIGYHKPKRHTKHKRTAK